MRRSAISGLALLAVAVLLAAGPAGAADRYAGRPLAEVLRALQAQGLEIVFSSALVTPKMVISAEPSAQTPRGILAEILPPFGLTTFDASGGRLVVVRRASETPPLDGSGTIEGAVFGQGEGALTVVATDSDGRQRSVGVASDGGFAFDGLPAGRYTVEVSGREILPARVEGVEVGTGSSTPVRVTVTSRRVLLEEIVVTPSHYTLLDAAPAISQFLSRADIQNMPHIADDLFRAVKRLPGASGSDYSARFNIRGGEQDEVLVLLDGLELYEPFHLKDFQNLFSIIDSEAVGGVELMTGGFPAEYGDRMSGVLNITMPPPWAAPRSSLTAGTLNGRLLSLGPLAGGRGQWLVSARGWYPVVVLEASDAIADEIVSDYYDVLARLLYPVGRRSTLATNFLAAYDRLGYSSQDPDESEQVSARYLSHHLWSKLSSQWSDSLSSQTILSTGRVRRERRGGVVDLVEGTLDVRDDRTFTFFGLRQDWTWSLAADHVLKWGIEARAQEADYDYLRASTGPGRSVPAALFPNTASTVLLRPEGTSYGTYLSDRFRLGTGVVAEIGLRWDGQTWLDDEQLSPRVNLMFTPSPQTTLRAAWGRFHQSQRLNELQVEDGVTRFFRAQRSEHWLASVEHRFNRGFELRVEAYSKTISRLRQRYENMFDPLELFPEARNDRIPVAARSGRARGVELLLKRGRDGGVAWWTSATVSRADDRVDGRWVPRSWDQRWAFDAGLDVPLGRGWNANLAASYHTGWPTTNVTGVLVEGEGGPEVELIYGPRNRARFDPYHRIDARVTKQLSTRAGDVKLILDVTNLTNHANPCCVEDFAITVRDDGSVDVQREERTWAPIVPSLALRWSF